MCIRDSCNAERQILDGVKAQKHHRMVNRGDLLGQAVISRCLLYTSDAADERSSVDLGGRRIIKKKNNAMMKHSVC